MNVMNWLKPTGLEVWIGNGRLISRNRDESDEFEEGCGRGMTLWACLGKELTANGYWLLA